MSKGFMKPITPEDLMGVDWRSLLVLEVLFIILIIICWFCTFNPPYLIYFFFVFLSIMWLFIELKYNWEDRKKVKKALKIALFLMVFDFVVENTGAYLGLWKVTGSVLQIGVVPIEVMLIAFFGGWAWALYLPKKYNKIHTFLDIVIFSVFGAVGEFLFVRHGFLVYLDGWTSTHAFIGYAATWVILHLLNYQFLEVG